MWLDELLDLFLTAVHLQQHRDCIGEPRREIVNLVLKLGSHRHLTNHIHCLISSFTITHILRLKKCESRAKWLHALLNQYVKLVNKQWQSGLENLWSDNRCAVCTLSISHLCFLVSGEVVHHGSRNIACPQDEHLLGSRIPYMKVLLSGNIKP